VILEEIECVVVGAGVVGLAIARALARAGREVLVVEAADGIGTETSSRNSEVIHAGIYYKAGGLMARHCVSGRRMLYDFCRNRGIAHSNCGKLIVAADEDEAGRLVQIKARAEANGVEAMQLLDRADARAREPALACTAALFSPTTGIVDSHSYMLALQGEAEAAGAIFVFYSPVRSGEITSRGIVLQIGGAEAMPLRSILGIPTQTIPTAYYAKGNYFTLTGRTPFSHLIYPAPVPGGLGVHLTIDLAGQARFGPDVEWVDRIDYRVDPSRSDGFYAAIRRYWPELPDGALQPGYSGIRPKIVPPEIATQDFVVQTEQVHGVPGLIALYGIESPGLTASLSLAAHVSEVIAASS
jgi:L-2-hydroxyglutarate oxidase LhgO